MTHTPGPWFIDANNPEMVFRPDSNDIRDYVCDCSFGSDNIANDFDDATVRANARLIAAAPELLAALVEQQRLTALLSSCIRGGETLNDDDELWYQQQRDQAAAAIAKATANEWPDDVED